MEVDSAAKIVLLVMIGLATGGLTGLTGASGMSILISGLLMVGCEIREVIGLTFLVTLVNSLTSVIPYWRRQLIDQRLAAALGVPAVAGVFAGHHLAEAVPDTWLQTVMLVALFAAGMRITLSRSMEQEAGRPTRRPPLSFVIPLGVAIGLIMGVMGGGGGLFIGAVLMIAFRIPVKRAIGTSILVMGVTAVPGLVLHGIAQTANWQAGGMIAVASTVAAFGSGRLATRVPVTVVKRFLGGYLLVISVLLAVKSLI
ncbi:MAG: hypothetical protein CMJ75_02290 [Planctomycetaceae bacterium]|nr:hypothetical protein [Planctomycetaceae bacterium]